MAKIIITTDTDAEAVWFMELCRKMGQKLEVDFGDIDIASVRGQLSEVRKQLPCPQSYAKSPFKSDDLARLCQKLKGKNRKK